ncbi:MAG: hypothetical protein IPO77_22680 [Acidobacteria bacterium]|nr:hypothetical protein [Acidobacteriota bacterium]
MTSRNSAQEIQVVLDELAQHRSNPFFYLLDAVRIQGSAINISRERIREGIRRPWLGDV